MLNSSCPFFFLWNKILSKRKGHNDALPYSLSSSLHSQTRKFVETKWQVKAVFLFGTTVTPTSMTVLKRLRPFSSEPVLFGTFSKLLWRLEAVHSDSNRRKSVEKSNDVCIFTIFPKHHYSLYTSVSCDCLSFAISMKTCQSDEGITKMKEFPGIFTWWRP